MTSSKRVAQVSLDGEIIEVFNSINSALKKHPDWQLTPISRVCRKLRKSAYGFGWYYYDSEDVWEPKEKILQIDPRTNEIVGVYNTITEARIAFNDTGSNISRCVNGQKKTHKGYIWKRGEK